MSSSTKVTFDVTTLEREVMAHHDKRVEAAQRGVDALNDDAAFAADVDGWRKDSTKRVLEFARRLRKGEVPDQELGTFKVASMPERPYYHRRDAQRSLEAAETARDRARLKFNSLRRNDDGTLSLTATQLRDYFGIA